LADALALAAFVDLDFAGLPCLAALAGASARVVNTTATANFVFIIVFGLVNIEVGRAARRARPRQISINRRRGLSSAL
jgi:hypothetical protein